MSDKELQKLSELIDRRTILRRVGAAALGLVLALFGSSGQVLAFTWYCCNLCQAPSPSCSNCACVWCWYCVYGQNTYQCCECHYDNSNCGENCYHVNCSHGKRTGYMPGGASPQGSM